MLDIAIHLMYQGAQVYWPQITPDIYREASQSIVARLDPTQTVTIEQMEKLLRAELLSKLLRFPFRALDFSSTALVSSPLSGRRAPKDPESKLSPVPDKPHP